MTWPMVIRRWIAAVLLSVAAVLAWRGGSGAQSVGRILPGLDAGTIGRLTVTSRGASSVFEADGLAWRQVEPYPCVADALAIRDALDVAAALPAYQSFPSDAVDRASLGLAEPSASLEVRGAGGSTTIVLGRRAPAGRAWVEVDGRVFSTDDALHALVASGDPRRWRDPALFERLSPDIDRITLRRGDASMVLERSGQRWSMREPIATRADAEAVGRWIDSLGRVRADAWVADLAPTGADLARFGLDAPGGSVTIATTARSLRDGQLASTTAEQVVEWGSVVERGTGLRVARRVGVPAVVSLDERALAAMDPAPESLIDGRMLDVPTSSIKSIAIDGPSGRCTVERREGQWFLVDAAHPEGTPARDPAVASLLVALTESRASALNEQGVPAGLTPTTVSVVGFDGATLGTLSIVREGTAGRFGVACGDGLLRVYSERTLLPLDPAQFVR